MKEIFFVLFALPGILAAPEQGAFEVNMSDIQNIAVFTKSMYANTSISVKILCNQDIPVDVTITWLLRWTPCAQEYANIDSEKNLASMYLEQPDMLRPDMPYQMVRYFKYTEPASKQCSKESYISLTEPPLSPTIVNGTSHVAVKKSTPEEKEKESAGKSRKKRAAPTTVKPGATVKPAAPNKVTTAVPPMTSTFAPFNPESNDEFHKITHTWEDGIYLFVLRVQTQSRSKQFNATVDVRMRGPNGGFLSAIEWPLLPFYGVMCVVYVIFGLVWLVLSFCNWRDLLRIQFWIGGVIFLGMLEKAVFFAEYESINATGKSVKGAIYFGEMVSCLKRTLARMLVIIVSLGFGIVKPRLGPVLHKVLALGGLYFILSAVEGCLRDRESKSNNSNQATLAAIPLAVLDAAICWWIFTGLVNTIRTLRLRRNLVKLSLYRHFTNTLIFAVVASVAFMVWSITQHKFSKCLSDWKELWVDEAFWHLLFSVILMVIMILWRPSANNQRYAFSPLMDAADDEAGEPMINDAFDGMKMRGVKGQANGSPGQREKSKADEDLKWIDENIPSAVADTALPSLLDSDEEMMNTKYEMSKME